MLPIPPGEEERFRSEVNAILEFFGDISGLPPLKEQPLTTVGGVRDDEVGGSKDESAAIARNFPRTEGASLSVPRSE